MKNSSPLPRQYNPYKGENIFEWILREAQRLREIAEKEREWRNLPAPKLRRM